MTREAAELQAIIKTQRELMQAVAESDAVTRRRQPTHWCNPTIDIMAQHLKETEMPHGNDDMYERLIAELEQLVQGQANKAAFHSNRCLELERWYKSSCEERTALRKEIEAMKVDCDANHCVKTRRWK